MKKILIIIGLALTVNILFAQSWAILKLDSICDPPAGPVSVSLTIEAIGNPGGNNLISSFGMNIQYDGDVLGDNVAIVNYSPQFPPANFLTNILLDVPEPGWNTIMIIYAAAVSGTGYIGMNFFDLQFNYIGPPAASDLIITGAGMYDDLGNPYDVTYINGYVGPCMVQEPTATLQIGTIYDPLPGIVLVPITCEAIENPLIGNNLVSSFGWYIAYDKTVLYAGEPNSPATLVNYNPEFSQSSYLTNIVADNPFPDWNTIAIIYSCACSGEVNPGDKFFDIQFSYSEGSTTEPNIIWTSLSGFETNMADDEGNEFLLTLIDGYVGPYTTNVPELNAETIKFWFENGNICFNAEAGGEFSLFNLFGQQVMSATVHLGLNFIPVKDKNAFYLVRIVTNNKTITQKIYIK